MSFVNTYWLYAIPVALLTLLILFYLNRRARKIFFENFASTKLLPNLLKSYSPTRYIIKKILIVLAFTLTLIALARPHWGYRWKEEEARGIDIIFALDTSKSMLAEDLAPNRLMRAKFAILDLLPKLQGDRIGLVAFAGNAFLQCPLTHDYDAFRHALDAVDTNIIARGGTDLANAIKFSESVYPKQHNYKFLILITDGEDLEESGIKQAQISAKNDVIIYTVGVGTAEGEIIPIPMPDGSRDYVRDSSGKVVKSALDEETLRKIAQSTGGFYTPLGRSGNGLESIYNAGLERIPQQDLNTSLKKVPLEQFQWAIGGSLLLLVIEFLMGNRKLTFRNRSNVILVLLGLVVFFNTAPQLEASPKKAMQAYEEGDFDLAIELYEKSLEKHGTDRRYHYNLGAALYQKKQYKEAARHYEEALNSDDLKLQEDALYNMGNADYRLGEELIEEDKEQTIKLWEDALKHYEAAIDLDEQDIDAQQNHAFVKQKLEELKSETPPPPQQNENQEDQKDQDQKEQPPEDNKDNQDKSEGNKDRNSQDSQENQEDPAEQEPELDDFQEKEDEAEQENQYQPKPGAMTQEEAEQLLNAQKEGERQLNLAPSENEESKQSRHIKDW